MRLVQERTLLSREDTREAAVPHQSRLLRSFRLPRAEGLDDDDSLAAEIRNYCEQQALLFHLMGTALQDCGCDPTYSLRVRQCVMKI